MTIKRKVKISNILMVTIPILFTAIVISICLRTSLGSYLYTFQSMYCEENAMLYAQSVIFNYQQELWENNWGQLDEITNEINHTDEMYHLENKLMGLGYHFTVTENEQQIYSNMTEEDLQTARSVAGDGIASAKSLTASRHEVSVIKNTFYHGDKAFAITAVHREATNTEAGIVTYFRNCIMKYLVGFILLFVGLSVLVNGIMSLWISRSILRPLNILRTSTKKIKDGILDESLNYGKKDEFGAVCADFEEMRAFLKESVEQRLRDEQRKRELIAGISHDLRTPLTSISGYVTGLLDGIADSNEKKDRYYKAIKLRTESMVSMVESLSEYCRLDSSTFQYHLEKTDLKEFIRKYIGACEYEVKQNNADVTFIVEDKEYFAEIDRKEMKRVFDNLFTNSMKYRISNHSDIRITLQQNLEEVFLKIAFADDGPGVPEESLDKIFDSFYRVDSARYGSEEGSGIGLAVVREIIMGHGGKIYAKNQHGLVIVMEIPISKEKMDEQNINY